MNDVTQDTIIVPEGAEIPNQVNPTGQILKQANAVPEMQPVVSQTQPIAPESQPVATEAQLPVATQQDLSTNAKVEKSNKMKIVLIATLVLIALITIGLIFLIYVLKPYNYASCARKKDSNVVDLEPAYCITKDGVNFNKNPELVKKINSVTMPKDVDLENSAQDLGIY